MTKTKRRAPKSASPDRVAVAHAEREALPALDLDLASEHCNAAASFLLASINLHDPYRHTRPGEPQFREVACAYDQKSPPDFGAMADAMVAHIIRVGQPHRYVMLPRDGHEVAEVAVDDGSGVCVRARLDRRHDGSLVMVVDYAGD